MGLAVMAVIFLAAGALIPQRNDGTEALKWVLWVLGGIVLVSAFFY